MAKNAKAALKAVERQRIDVCIGLLTNHELLSGEETSDLQFFEIEGRSERCFLTT
jgi:hypothetical protein